MPFGGILCQPFEEIDMAPIKPRDRVVSIITIITTKCKNTGRE
jgi:hypothetical protein